MNAFFGSTDIDLNGPESTFCPFILFFDKKKFVLEKVILFLKNKVNLSHFSKNTIYRKQKAEKGFFYKVVVENA